MVNKRVRMPILLALFTAVICVTSFIAIPLFGVPITMQSFGVAMALFMLGGARACASVFAYVIIGAVGLPVFSGFSGGLGVMLGPTGGFIIGFLLLAVIYHLVTVLFGSSSFVKIAACTAGHIAMYVLGAVWFYVFFSNGATFFEVLLITVVPFLIPDALKVMLAFLLSQRLNKLIRI